MERTFISLAPLLTTSPPAPSTIASICAVLRPASPARMRVTVKSASGSMLSARSRLGESVGDLPLDENETGMSIVPSVISWKVTFDCTFVMTRSDVNGFASETTVWAMLFSWLVVLSTVHS